MSSISDTLYSRMDYVSVGVVELASIFSVSVTTINNWHKRNLLPRADGRKRFKTWKMSTIRKWLDGGNGLAGWLVKRMEENEHHRRYRAKVSAAREFKRQDAPSYVAGAVIVRRRQEVDA